MTAPNDISPIHSRNEKALMLAIISQLARNRTVPPHPTHSAFDRWANIDLSTILLSLTDGQPLVRRFQDSEKFWIMEMVENVPKLFPDIQEQ